ncbi:MAG: hypothetical protein ACRC1P_09635 [Cellulosilyticaceae bacterium]
MNKKANDRLLTCQNVDCKQKVLLSQMIIHQRENKSGKTIIERYCCQECYDKVMKARNDKIEHDKCYDYIRYQILQYPEGRLLPTHIRNRLTSLTQGKYQHRGKLIDRVYTYEQIYNTLLVSKGNIQKGMRANEFKDDSHLSNYIFSIIINNINDVVLRMERKIKADEKLDTVVIEMNHHEYVRKEKSKVANKLKDLF